MSKSDDTISRQAAIDAAIEAADDWDGGCNKERERFIRDALEELPSAQPEIIRCKDCKYQDKGENESASWNICGYRPWLYVPVTDDHYCGDGKREEDA